MTEREKAISYLTQGHALLRAHGLYGSSENEHVFAIDRALEGFERNGGYPSAPEAAAAIQALYEAKRLITARASIQGRRIILGDWFLSHAVGLALPLRTGPRPCAPAYRLPVSLAALGAGIKSKGLPYALPDPVK